MRKLFVIITLILLLITMGTQVYAANAVKSAQADVVVLANSSCQVNISMTVHLDAPVDPLLFPIPLEATGVTLDGSRVSAPKDGDLRYIDLTEERGLLAGDFSFQVYYNLPDVTVITQTDTQQLELPLLCGFAYTIENLDFSVTLPGAVEAKPAFTSGYHQAGIEADLSCTVDGAKITGKALKPLKDHETLTLLLPVSDEMFPRSIVEAQSPATAGIAMAICAGLALIYWLLTMRHLPIRLRAAAELPEGVDAGTVGCVLGMQGMDLTLTVLNWAQLGYIRIHRDTDSHIILYKRMEMGNERTESERRCFHKLFGKRNQADTASFAYAQLQRDLRANPVRVQEFIRKRSGSPRLFRLLASGIGLFGGAGIGMMLGSGASLQGFLIILLGLFGAVTGWFMTGWAKSLQLHRQNSLALGLLLGVFWLLMGLLAGVFLLALWMVVGLLVAGLLLRIGGRRTEVGHQAGAQLRGLRRHLRRVSTATVRQRTEIDGDYFFRMFPCAMALGVEKKFAQAFGGMRLNKCPWLTGAGNEDMNAQQWYHLLCRVAETMENRANSLPLEKLLGTFKNLTGR